MLSGSLRPVPRDQFGDLAVTILTPWHLNPDPGARRLHQQLQLPTSAPGKSSALMMSRPPRPIPGRLLLKVRLSGAQALGWRWWTGVSLGCKSASSCGRKCKKFFLMFIYSFFFFNVYVFIFLRQRESMNRGGSERGRHRIPSRLQAPSCQHRARRGARTHEL